MKISTADFLRDECGIEDGKPLVPTSPGFGAPSASEFIAYIAPKIDELITRHVSAALRNVERALPAKTSIVETQKPEVTKPVLKVIDAVRTAIKEQL